MRDLERWKEQVELSLDGRQIFFLFFGSAIAACVIFVAGVLVGKRIEQRACAPAAVADPLAVLDQLGAGEDDGLTFHEALARRQRQGRRAEAPAHRPDGEAAAARPDDSTGDAARTHAAAATLVVEAETALKKPDAALKKPDAALKKPDAALKKPDAASKKPEPAEEPAAKAAAPRKATQEAGAAPSSSARPSDAAQVAAKPPARKTESTPPSRTASKAEASVAPAARKADALAAQHKSDAAAGAHKTDAAAGAHKTDAAQAPQHTPDERYTLQISAFTEKTEAEDFLKKIQSAGYHPFLVRSDIPGRGTFYRVRVGDYSSRKAANDAKTDFERRHHLPVYVARL